MGIHIRLIRIMDVVRCHKRNSGILAQPQKLLIHGLLFRQPMILQLQKIIPVPKGSVMPQRRLLCLLIKTAQQKSLHFTGETCAQHNQPLMVSLKHFPVHPWTVIVPLGETAGDNLHQILIAGIILCKQNQMKVAVFPLHFLTVKS